MNAQEATAPISNLRVNCADACDCRPQMHFAEFAGWKRLMLIDANLQGNLAGICSGEHQSN